LAWSRNLEPEHFTLANQELVGSGLGRVQALLPTQTALLVFTSGGLFKLSGDGAESGFRVDLVDQDLRLLFPDAACALDGVTYAWGDRGVYQCTENGVDQISEPIQDQLDPYQREFATDTRTVPGVFLVGNRKEREFILALPGQPVDVNQARDAQYWLVFNCKTGSWVRWILPAVGDVNDTASTYSTCAVTDNRGTIWYKPTYFDTSVDGFLYRAFNVVS
jgi:hypothetical protein